MIRRHPLYRLPASVLLTLTILIAGCSSLPDKNEATAEAKTKIVKKPSATKSAEKTKKTVKAVETTNLWDDLVKGYSLPTVPDERVNKNLRWLSNNQRYLDRVTEQSRPYLHYLANELKANDMPLELALLPIVESAYNPFAVSPSKAVGIWQFMPQDRKSVV